MQFSIEMGETFGSITSTTCTLHTHKISEKYSERKLLSEEWVDKWQKRQKVKTLALVKHLL
jgi:hypothetical protein